jgi:hypothetical protein
VQVVPPFGVVCRSCDRWSRRTVLASAKSPSQASGTIASAEAERKDEGNERERWTV